jgi:metal-dependent amidase/aminoacylase/carboxypeptidase family protein
VSYGFGIPVNVNAPKLVEQMLPTLERVAGSAAVRQQSPVMGYEDFAYFQQQIPGMFVFLGARSPATPRNKAAPNHSPYFVIDEAALRMGVRTLASLALDFLYQGR